MVEKTRRQEAAARLIRGLHGRVTLVREAGQHLDFREWPLRRKKQRMNRAPVLTREFAIP